MRIRTVKPMLFKHEELYDAEEESGLPLRLVYIGLFCCCDREGRFKWKIRSLKSDVLPYDEIKFSDCLEALMTYGFVKKYTVEEEQYGCIPSFLAHQVINNREMKSVIPDISQAYDITVLPRVDHASGTREARVDHAACARTGGREGNMEGKGREGNMETRGAVGAQILDQADDSELDIPNELSGKPLSDEQLYQGVVTEDWYRQIHKVAKIGAKSWNKWQDILEHTFSNNLDELVTFCRSYPGECWPDDIKKAYIKKNPQTQAAKHGRKAVEL